MSSDYLTDETRPVKNPEKRKKAKHNLSYTRIYRIWKSMIARCERPGTNDYEYYGGRGVKVCDDWHALNNFVRDMGASYFKGATIDRRDGTGNYEPENCRWVTMKEQQRNRASNRIITYSGESHCLAEWAERLGLDYARLQRRVRDYGEQEAIRLTLESPKNTLLPKRLKIGENHPSAKLNDKEVEQILLFLQPGVTCKEAAEKFGLRYNHVRKIALGIQRANVRPDIVRPVGRFTTKFLPKSRQVKQEVSS